MQKWEWPRTFQNKLCKRWSSLLIFCNRRVILIKIRQKSETLSSIQHARWKAWKYKVKQNEQFSLLMPEALHPFFSVHYLSRHCQFLSARFKSPWSTYRSLVFSASSLCPQALMPWTWPWRHEVEEYYTLPTHYTIHAALCMTRGSETHQRPKTKCSSSNENENMTESKSEQQKVAQLKYGEKAWILEWEAAEEIKMCNNAAIMRDRTWNLLLLCSCSRYAQKARVPYTRKKQWPEHGNCH